MSDEPADDGRPTLRVISGDATPEEIAAILAIVAARGAVPTGHEPAPEQASVWSDPTAGHRGRRARFTSAPDGWRTSFWPS
jgi:hypothetical protein